MTVPGVIEVVRRSNQRGGRMLSVLDLVEAGTLTLPLAAWLLARVAAGSSWLVGARPGGAGKTTIMGALLAMLPEAEAVHLATAAGSWRRARPGECVVAYEIGPGDYEAYVWGEELRELAALGARGCRIVSNPHADTLEEAREQLVSRNSVPGSDFDRFDLFLPIRLRGSGRRPNPTVPMVWLCTGSEWQSIQEPSLDREGERIRAWLDRAGAEEARSVEQVRGAWLRFAARGAT